MKNLIEVSVDSIRIHMPTAQHLVILKEKEADRYLPIWIGSSEAQAIATKISGNVSGGPSPTTSWPRLSSTSESASNASS